MSKVIRTATKQVILLAAAATVACSASTSSSSEDVSSSDQAITVLPCGGHPCYDDYQPPPPKPPPIIVPYCTSHPTAAQCKPTVDCGFSPTCPPGQYNDTTGGYLITPATAATPTSGAVPGSVAGCSFTAPAACETGTPGADGFAATTAPEVIAVTAGPSTVYAIGIPSTPITSLPATGASYSDKRTAVYAWGDNSHYQLGNGGTAASATPQVPFFDPNHAVLQVAAGVEDACALVSDGSATGGTVHCWGTIMTTPNQVQWTTQHQVAFPAGTSIAGITHGNNHSCAWTTDASPLVYCWGNNLSGQLGVSPSVTGGFSTSYAGTAIQVPFSTYNVQASSQIGTIVSVAASGDTTCALAWDAAGDQTNVYCWGDDELGSLGNGEGTPGDLSYTPVLASGPSIGGFGGGAAFTRLVAGSGNYGSFCAESGGSWYCWGADDQMQIDEAIPAPNPNNGELGVTQPSPLGDASIASASFIAVGANHGCAEVGGFLYCFGNNDEGQLGVAGGMGSGNDTFAQQAAAAPAGFSAYTAAAMGENMTCAISVPAAGSPAPAYSAANTSNLACWGGDSSVLFSAATYKPTPLAWW